MNRRFFLSTSMLSGLGVLTSVRPSRALSLEKCDADSNGLACGEFAKHADLLAQIDTLLAQNGLDEAARKAALAAATCPFCGQPMGG